MEYRMDENHPMPCGEGRDGNPRSCIAYYKPFGALHLAVVDPNVAHMTAGPAQEVAICKHFDVRYMLQIAHLVD